MRRPTRASIVWLAVLVALLVGLKPSLVRAQNPYYLRTTAPLNWIDPSAHTVIAFTSGASCSAGTYFNAPNDDDISAPINIGFTFNFGGTNYTQVQVQSNGRVQFNNSFCGYGTQTTGTPPTYPYPYPHASLVRTMRVYGGDLFPGQNGAGQVRYATLGSAPNRTFVVTWVNVQEWNSGPSLFNLQVILYESSNEFVYQYKDIVNQNAGAAQIGWEISTSNYEVVPYGGFGTLAFSALRFYPAPVKLAQYRMDEISWTGVAGEVADNSGNGYHGRAVNGAAIADGTRAYTNPSNGTNTCRFGSFKGQDQYVELPKFPELDATQSPTGFTITAWIRTADRGKSGQRILIDDEGDNAKAEGFGFSLGDGGAGRVRLYSRSTTPVILDTAAVIDNNTWYFVAASVDFGAQRKSIYVFDQAGALVTSVSDTYIGPWVSHAGTASIGGETGAAIGENNAAFRFAGDIDEVGVFRGALDQSILSVFLQDARLCTEAPATLGRFNAFESTTAAGATSGFIKTKIAGMSFSTSTGNLALVAINSARTAVDTTFTGDVKVEFLDASSGGTIDANGCSAANAWPVIQTLANVTFAAGNSGRVTLPAAPSVADAWRSVRVRVSYPATGAATLIGCSSDAFAIRPNRFLVTGANDNDWQSAGVARSLANVNAFGGAVHKAGTPFTMQVTAINGAGAGTANYSGTPQVIGTAMRLPDPAVCTTCVPGVFTPGAWSSRGAGVVRTDTATYSEAGALAAQVEDRTWAIVDVSDSTEAERYIPSAPFNIGRFVPDRFELSLLTTPSFRTFGSDDLSCNVAASAPKRSFTYMGQPFDLAAALQVRIEAKNASGAITRNYRSTLWKLGAGTAVQNANCAGADPNCTFTANFSAGGAVSTLARNYSYTTAPALAPGWDTALGGGATPSIASNNDGSGTVTHAAADRLAFARNSANPVRPYTANIALGVSVSDASEATVTGNGTITTTTAASANPVAFDSGAEFRYGRLRVLNASGSQLLPLIVPLETQYWNGTGFATNSADHCTTIVAANIGLGNHQRNLSSGETNATLGAGPFLGGVKPVTLSAPGAGNDGAVDLAINLGATANENLCGADTFITGGANLAWLRSRWCGASFDRDPVARATFGIFRAASPIVYVRENY